LTLFFVIKNTKRSQKNLKNGKERAFEVGTLLGIKLPTKKDIPKNVEAKKNPSGIQAHLKPPGRHSKASEVQKIDLSVRQTTKAT